MFHGTLLGIYTAPSSGAPMIAHQVLTAKVGVGLADDRYATDVARHPRGYTKIRHVTLLEEETVIALGRDHGLVVASIDLRRNLVTRDVPLNHLIGRRFWVGEVELVGTELAEPCQYVADLIGVPVLKPLVHRGGIRAEIVTGGELRVGASITPAGAGAPSS